MVDPVINPVEGRDDVRSSARLKDVEVPSDSSAGETTHNRNVGPTTSASSIDSASGIDSNDTISCASGR